MLRTFTLLIFSLFTFFGLSGQIIITAVFDGPLSGGTPKGAELYVTEDIDDLSLFGIGSANNGGGTDSVEFSFPSVPASMGTYLYVATEAENFNTFFGFDPDFTDGAMSINGDDAIELFLNGTVIDVFGDINEDGTGTPWEYLDGWAYRVSDTGPDGSTFVIDNWTFSGINALDGATTNAGALNPVPIQTYAGGGGFADYTVTVQSNFFDPADLTIETGQSVKWVNLGGFHNVNGSQATYPNNPESFGSGAASSDPWEYIFTFTIPGVYDYQCDPHVGFGMIGTVVVEDPAGPEYPLYDIAIVTTEDADGVADSSGVLCTLSGNVYGVNLGSGLSFTMIDNNGDGINVYSSSNDFGYEVKEGDNLEVFGRIGQYNGLTQISPDTVILVSSGNPLLDPVVVTELSEVTESKLIKIENLTIVDPAEWSNSGSGFNVELSDGVNTFFMRVDNDVDVYGTDPPTQAFNLTGLGGQFDSSSPYDGGYQIFPRYLADIDLISGTNDLPFTQYKISPNPVMDYLNLPEVSNNAKLNLFDINGKSISVVSSNDRLDVSNLTPGIYTLRIIDGENRLQGRFIKN
jgi:plastocyanin